MHSRLRIIGRLMIALSAVMPMTAHASGNDISNIFLGLIGSFAPLWITAAILVIVIAGFALMISQDEGRLEKTKKVITAVIIGGMGTTIIVVGGPLTVISILYNGVPGIALINSGSVIGLEAVGISQWITAIAAMGAVLMIIIAALQAVTSIGDEAAYTKVRSAIGHAIIGLIIIAAAFIFEEVFFVDRVPNALIALIASKILIVLAVIMIIAVAVLVYAGFRMVISFGKEEDYTSAKSLAIRVGIGILIILISYILVLTVSVLFS